MKKKTIIKKNFTLLEIIICISLLSICFSFVGIKINDALYSYKFKSSLKKIDVYIDFCQKMARSNQADIYLKLSQKNKKVFLEIGTDDKMGFFKNNKKISDVFENLFFDFEEKKTDCLEFVFSSSGETFPKGNFIFYDKKNKFKENKAI
ncbi:MAG: prepilin-type N-terminal cleavage/methylation domain-containing protein [Parachlamydiales bacterium]|jgi:prepilin-type N-terminal cleavage/methylation domain-containing protein